MKRLVTLMLAAGLVLGGASISTASAVEIKAGGTWQFGLSWWDKSVTKGDSGDRFFAKQRIRPEFRFIADENLKGVLQFEIGNFDWGNGAAALGNDGKEVKVRYGYVDWKVPGAGSNIRMGMQYFETANVFGAPVMNADTAGISLTHQFCDNLGLSLAWMRPYNSNTTTAHDAIDLFYIAVPMKSDGFTLTPWAMYMTIGEHAGTLAALDTTTGNSDLSVAVNGLMPAYPAGAHTNSNNGKAFWMGFGGELTLFDPLTIALDVNYGRADIGYGEAYERKGWQFLAKAAYKFDCVTPALLAWYATGDDADLSNGSERMPLFYGDAYATNFGMDGGWYDAGSLTLGLPGTWGLGLHFDNISFVESLTHNVRFTLYGGTNNREAVKAAGLTSYQDKAAGRSSYQDKAVCVYMANGDRAYEISLENKWQVYKNLALAVDLGYIDLDLKDKTWDSRSAYDDKMFKAAVYATYKF